TAMRRGPPLWAVSGVPRWSVAPRLRQSWSSLTLSLHHCGPGTGIAAHTAVRARLEGAPSGLGCRLVGGVVGRGSIARCGTVAVRNRVRCSRLLRGLGGWGTVTGDGARSGERSGVRGKADAAGLGEPSRLSWAGRGSLLEAGVGRLSMAACPRSGLHPLQPGPGRTKLRSPSQHDLVTCL